MSTQKQLGQSAPNADTDTILYTVPATTETSNVVLLCCNHGGVHDTIEVAYDDTGAASSIADGNKLYSDVPIPKDRTVRLPIGPMSTSGGDLLVNSKLGHVTFTLSGTERDTS